MTRLTKEAITFLKKDAQLVAQVADALGLSVTSIGTTLSRNAGSLTRLPSLRLIAQKMGKTPDEIIMEKDAVTAQ